MATLVEVSEPAVARPPRFAYLEWSPVIAGALGAAALSLLFLTFGSALGLSVVSPYPYSGLNPTTFLIVVALFASLVHVASFAAGGYLAGRMRTPWFAGAEPERNFRDGTYGFAVWALGLLIGAALAVSGAGGVLSTAMNATAAVSAAAAGGAMMNPNRVAMGPSDMAIDLLLRPAPDQAKAVAPAMPATPAPAATVTPPAQTAAQPDSAPATDPKPAAPGMPSTDMSSTGMSMDTMHRAMREERRGELQAPLARVFMTSLRDGTLAARDRTYLAQIVSHQTGLPQAEAEKRVDEVYAEAKAAEQKARDAAERARKLGAIGAFLAAASLAIACAAACIAAAAGGRHRDEATPARMFGGRRFW